MPEPKPPFDASISVPLQRSRSDIRQVEATRELFWNNLLREILNGLASLSATGRHPEMFDGRLGLITNSGNRIAIGSVTPLFACGVSGTAAQKSLSIMVECTVFQVVTPDGEVFTLPVHEIRMFHSLSEELVERFKAAARAAEQQDDAGEEPFGFAAFTSLSRQRGMPPEGGIVGPGLG